MTGADDQRLHTVGKRHYWEGVADRILLRRESMVLLFAAYLLTNGAFVIIAPTLARGGLINSDKCYIYPCQGYQLTTFCHSRGEYARSLTSVPHLLGH